MCELARGALADGAADGAGQLFRFQIEPVNDAVLRVGNVLFQLLGGIVRIDAPIEPQDDLSEKNNHEHDINCKSGKADAGDPGVLGPLEGQVERRHREEIRERDDGKHHQRAPGIQGANAGAHPGKLVVDKRLILGNARFSFQVACHQKTPVSIQGKKDHYYYRRSTVMGLRFISYIFGKIGRVGGCKCTRRGQVFSEKPG